MCVSVQEPILLYTPSLSTKHSAVNLNNIHELLDIILTRTRILHRHTDKPNIHTLFFTLLESLNKWCSRCVSFLNVYSVKVSFAFGSEPNDLQKLVLSTLKICKSRTLSVFNLITHYPTNRHFYNSCESERIEKEMLPRI